MLAELEISSLVITNRTIGMVLLAMSPRAVSGPTFAFQLVSITTIGQSWTEWWLIASLT